MKKFQILFISFLITIFTKHSIAQEGRCLPKQIIHHSQELIALKTTPYNLTLNSKGAHDKTTNYQMFGSLSVSTFEKIPLIKSIDSSFSLKNIPATTLQEVITYYDDRRFFNR